MCVEMLISKIRAACQGGVYIYGIKCSMVPEMKQILLMFGSIAAILLGAVLLCVNLFLERYWEILSMVGDGFGILFLAAGVTGVWALRHVSRS